jgi:hypothetical protein
MYATALEAFQKLSEISIVSNDTEGNKARLLNFVDQLSVEARGAARDAITVLYSGDIGDVKSATIAEAMRLDPNIRVLD